MTLLMLLIMITSACTEPELPPGGMTRIFPVATEAQRDIALSIMRTEGIPYVISTRGDTKYVVYHTQNIAQVLGIVREARYGSGLSPLIWESAVLVNSDIRQMYEQAFRESNIPYSIYETAGVVQIEWNQTFGPQVDQIRQYIAEQVLEGYRSERRSLTK